MTLIERPREKVTIEPMLRSLMTFERGDLTELLATLRTKTGLFTGVRQCMPSEMARWGETFRTERTGIGRRFHFVGRQRIRRRKTEFSHEYRSSRFVGGHGGEQVPTWRMRIDPCRNSQWIHSHAHTRHGRAHALQACFLPLLVNQYKSNPSIEVRPN